MKCSMCSIETKDFGTYSDGKKYCYECCAAIDLRIMSKFGKIALYYDGNKVTNWPGTLKFTVFQTRKGSHNIAGKRYDVWFKVGKQVWHGVQYGDDTQILHCKLTKAKG